MFAGGGEGLPGAGFRGRVHKAAHQQVVPAVRGPEQLQAGEGWALADLGPHLHQPFGGPEVARLVGEGQLVLLKVLLHRRQIDALVGAAERKGRALVPLAMYWKDGRAKLEIGVARGKKEHDKRDDLRERDWQRERARVMKARR